MKIMKGERKKNVVKRSDRDREILWEIVQHVKIPVLTLDERFNELFADLVKQPGTREIIKRLNSLMKEQGGVVNRVKELKVLKKRLMTNIVDNMNEVEDKEADQLRGKKQDANKRLINDINIELDESKDRLLALPYEIMDSNRKLLLESLVYSYEIINENTLKSKALDEDITRLQAEIEEKVNEKIALDNQTSLLYGYMHDMVGADMLEKMDEKLGE